MPGTPKPVGSNAGMPVIWNAMLQKIASLQQSVAALGSIAQLPGAATVQSSVNTGTFAPTSADSQQAMTTPAVTAQIGTSGKAILAVSSIIGGIVKCCGLAAMR